MGPQETGAQTAELYAAGWRRFKAPTGGAVERSAARLRAARAAAPGAWLGMDAAWTYAEVDAAAEFIAAIPDVGLGWFEDVFPPGDAGQLARLRRRIDVPIAQGDEQGGSYYPEALILAGAADVIRVDLTCMGGITAGRRVIDEALAAGLSFAPHMFPHVHSQVLSAWGFEDVPIEWGIPGTGVHPMDDALPGPRLTHGGLMEALPEEPGFGRLVDADWIRGQPHDDPEGILDGL
jgi:L-alanine-DL-glutamate epimerase-like enolase superfamily enzyme